MRGAKCVLNQIATAILNSLILFIALGAHAQCNLGPITITANKTSICLNDSATICAPVGFATYAWVDGETTSCVSAVIAGYYQVTVTDSNGCSATSNDIVISVLRSPLISVSISGDTLQGGNETGYQWYSNFQPIPGATSAYYIFTASGDYSLLGTGANGCSAFSNSVEVIVDSGISIAVEAIRPSCLATSTGIAVVSANGQPPFRYQWSTGQTTDTATGLQGGGYAVTVTAANEQSASGYCNVGTDNLAGDIITIIHCLPQADTVIMSVFWGSPGYGNITYTLSNGDTGSLITPIDSGRYICTITDAALCTASVPIYIPYYPQLNFETAVTGSSDSNGAITVQITSGLGPFYYNWSNGDSTATISNLPPGIYTVEVSDSVGCLTIQSDTVNSISGINQLHNSANDITLFPNPSDGQFALKLPGTGYLSVKIFDGLGRLIFERRLNEAEPDKNLQLDLSMQASGNYTLQLETLEGTVSKPLIMER